MFWEQFSTRDTCKVRMQAQCDITSHGQMESMLLMASWDILLAGMGLNDSVGKHLPKAPKTINIIELVSQLVFWAPSNLWTLNWSISRMLATTLQRVAISRMLVTALCTVLLWLPEHGNEEVDQQNVGENHVDSKQWWHNGILRWTSLNRVLAPYRLIASAAIYIITCSMKSEKYQKQVAC